MEKITAGIASVDWFLNGIVWGPFMLAFFVGTGLYLSVKIKFLQVTKFRYTWKHTLGTLFVRKQGKEAGKNVTAFQAMTTALAATAGVGNIAGVAGAIVSGGPGAIFWMWVSAFFGMALKYAEIVLAVKYREVREGGAHYGGPMYYIEKGLKRKGLAVLFALFGGLACFGIGNMTQSSEIAGAMNTLTGLSPLVIGVAVAAVTGLVIIGGIKRIGSVTGILVPFMAVFYVLGGLLILFVKADQLPAAFRSIISGAFSLKAAGGGVMGYAMMLALKNGFARGVFSNEAGLGSAPIAHAAASTKEPVIQGLWGVIEVFIDTIVICTVTALVVIISGMAGTATDAAGNLLTGGALTSAAFDALAGFGGTFVRVSIVFFALATILGWNYYGERCWGYLTGDNRTALFIYRIAFVFFTVVGANGDLALVWSVADTLNGLMAIPNLAALLGLSGVTAEITREYFAGRSL